MAIKLIAESGATKCNWYLLNGKVIKKISSIGLSPYQLSIADIASVIEHSIAGKIKKVTVGEVCFYGTGMSSPTQRKKMRQVLAKYFPQAEISIETDLTASAHAACGNAKGIVSILGTGSGAAFYNGKKIVKVRNGIGYILGDEGSGAYLGRKVIQYYLYQTFDDELMRAFDTKYNITKEEILNNVYHQPLAGKYLAEFTTFLSENRGHYMIENIIEDGLNDFIVTHIYKFREAWLYPLHFTGGVAFAFKDVLKELCSNYELELGNIIQYPIDGLVKYHL
ncbi:N-acetylglucosamine kinase [Arachidicoccus ginsenosidimutans]|uniref:N-acetylglucosamine kinase n=1 Tax=Arachidicoccus sp. BS20 TaxID=1850526 RepID=UPI0007F0EB76|nr:N-acetylglucosamine kinase [Arachidicoccus sp. BS20]ANI88344.1 N-acetylglucosamine kinase [Arachidicoccus sp. BS20]